MMEIVLMIVNVACLVGVMCAGVKAWRMKREAEEVVDTVIPQVLGIVDKYMETEKGKRLL